MLALSCCAMDARIVTISSPEASNVFTLSFSKISRIPRPVSSLTISRHSEVLRAKREMDFVMITSTAPASQS